MKVKVMKTDIKKGLRGLAGRCPIALALERSGVGSPRVYDDHIEGWFNHNTLNFKTSRRAGAFIRKFDSGKRVKPISFIIPSILVNF